MINPREACIFEHEGFTYVVNFDTMTIWIITEEDEANLVTTLSLQRLEPKVWAYRPENSEGEFTVDSDADLVKKLEQYYYQFINQIIVGQDGRVHTNQVTKVKLRCIC